MVIQVLAVIDRSLLDLADRFVDLFDSVIFLSIHAAGPRPTLQMSARMTEVGEGVQVGGMTSWLVGESQSSAKSHQKHHYGTMSSNRHSLLE
jgi:hypothetical protein